MAVAEVEELTTRECPACGGAMEQTQSICAECRVELEAYVMSAPAPTATAPVNITPAPAVRAIPRVSPPSASLRPPGTPTASHSPAMPVGHLESGSRWQHTLIAVGLVVLAAGMAFGVWSFMTPHGADPDDAVAPATTEPDTAPRAAPVPTPRPNGL